MKKIETLNVEQVVKTYIAFRTLSQYPIEEVGFDISLFLKDYKNIYDTYIEKEVETINKYLVPTETNPKPTYHDLNQDDKNLITEELKKIQSVTQEVKVPILKRSLLQSAEKAGGRGIPASVYQELFYLIDNDIADEVS